MFKLILLLIFAPGILFVNNITDKIPDNLEPSEILTEETVFNEEVIPETEKELVISDKKIKVEEKPKEVKVENAVKSDPIITQEIPVKIPDFEEINIFTRSATVNILCSTEGGELSPISGTGVVVDPSGVILTNAHIGQYLLLKDFKQKDFVSCVIRTGSPAYPRYKVELMYISPVWVENNKSLLTQNEQKGTGERDFAFLRITERVDGTPIGEIPFIPISTREFFGIGEAVLLSSYPAGFLGGISILQDLNITTAITGIADVYTFSENLIDLLLVPGTIVSQKGSSGGAVVDGEKNLLGIIVTSSDAKTTSERSLYAITGAYINRSLEDEIKINLNQFLSQDKESFAKIFQEVTAPTLTKLIVDEILKKSN